MEKNSNTERPFFKGKMLKGDIHGEQNSNYQEITLEDGKYRVIIRQNSFECKVIKRNKLWIDFIGDKFVYALCQRILELEQEIKKRKKNFLE
jgi:hypothetical protein